MVSRSARSEVQGSPVIDELKRLGMENIFLCDVIVQCVCVCARACEKCIEWIYEEVETYARRLL